MGSKMDVYFGQACLEKPMHQLSKNTNAYSTECTFNCHAHRLETDGIAVLFSRVPCRLEPFLAIYFTASPEHLNILHLAIKEQNVQNIQCVCVQAPK